MADNHYWVGEEGAIYRIVAPLYEKGNVALMYEGDSPKFIRAAAVFDFTGRMQVLSPNLADIQISHEGLNPKSFKKIKYQDLSADEAQLLEELEAYWKLLSPDEKTRLRSLEARARIPTTSRIRRIQKVAV